MCGLGAGQANPRAEQLALIHYACSSDPRHRAIRSRELSITSFIESQQEPDRDSS